MFSHERIELCKTIYKSPTNSNHLSSKPSTLDQCGTPFVHHLFWGCSRHWLCLAALGWNFGRTRHRRHWCFLNCLVVDLPLWNIWVSWDDDIPNMMGKMGHVPNHQPVKIRGVQVATKPNTTVLTGHINMVSHMGLLINWLQPQKNDLIWNTMTQWVSSECCFHQDVQTIPY